MADKPKDPEAESTPETKDGDKTEESKAGAEDVVMKDSEASSPPKEEAQNESPEEGTRVTRASKRKRADDTDGKSSSVDILGKINSEANKDEPLDKDGKPTKKNPGLQTLADSALEQERKENAEKAAAEAAAAAVGIGIIEKAEDMEDEAMLAAAGTRKRRRSRPIKTFADPEKQEKLEDYRRKKRERQKMYRQRQKAEEAEENGDDAKPARKKRGPKKEEVKKDAPLIGDEGEDGKDEFPAQDWRETLCVPALPEDGDSKGFIMSEEDPCTWDVKFIPLTVSRVSEEELKANKAVAAEAGEDPPLEVEEQEIEINFADTIGCVDGKKMRWVKNQSKIFLPKEYNQNSREYRAKVLGPLMGQACAKTGSKVMMYGWEPLKGNAKFGCYRCRTQQYKTGGTNANAGSNKNALNGADNMTLKPSTHSELCRFSFHVYWDDEVDRWYIKRFGAGFRNHQGHPRMDPFDAAAQKGQEPSNDEIRSLHRERGPYSISHPLFSEIANSIQEPDDSIHFRRLLMDFKEYLQQKVMIQQQQQQEQRQAAQKGSKAKEDEKKKAAQEEEEEGEEDNEDLSDSSDDEDAKGLRATTTPTGAKFYHV